MKHECLVLCFALAACGADGVRERRQAVAGAVTLADCAGMFAADIGAECSRMEREKLPGEEPSADGFVPGPGGPFGDEPGAEAAAPMVVPPEKHCGNEAELGAAGAKHLSSLRECLATRKDLGTACTSLDEVGCPPGVSEAECEYARSAAAAACAETL
jgi:hypothetical protein